MRYGMVGGPGGLGVSELCLGTLPFGSLVDDDTSFAILDRYADAGGTFLDTADNYVSWVPGFDGSESECLLGRWLGRRGAGERMVVATKVGALPRRSNDWNELEGLSAEVIRRQAARSLRRLGTDRIDLYYAHVEDRSVPLEETIRAFAEVVGSGTVGMLGCSNHTTWLTERSRGVARAHGWPGYRVIQQRHTYLQPRPGADFGVQRYADAELLDYVRHQPDLTLLAYSPLLSGAYTRPDRELPEQYRHSGTDERLRVLGDIARELDATPNQVVLAWLLGSDPPTIPVLGVSTVAQLDECLAASDLELGAEVRARLDQAG